MAAAVAGGAQVFLPGPGLPVAPANVQGGQVFLPGPGLPSQEQQARPVAAAVSAEEWLAAYRSPPVAGTHKFSYFDSVCVEFGRYRRLLSYAAAANVASVERICKAIESNQVMNLALQLFRMADVDRSGVLTYDDGRVRDYVSGVLRHGGVHPPAEGHIYQFYMLFDPQSRRHLDARDCICLVDALLRAICYHFLHPVDPGKENVGPSGRAFGLSAPVEVRLRKEDGTLSTRCYQGTVAAYAKDGSYTVLLATDAVVTGVLESHLQLPGTQEQQQQQQEQAQQPKAPQIDSVDVEIFNAMQNSWSAGKVMCKGADGALTVRCGDAMKLIKAEFIASMVRPAGGEKAGSNPPTSSVRPPSNSIPATHGEDHALLALKAAQPNEASTPHLGSLTPSRVASLPTGMFPAAFAAGAPPGGSHDAAPPVPVLDSNRPKAIQGSEKLVAAQLASPPPISAATPAVSSPIDVKVAPTYVPGLDVEIYSISQDKWIAGRVSSVAPDGAVTVVYGSTQKTVVPESLASVLRVLVGAKASTPGSAAQGEDPLYRVGQSVEIFSKSQDKWVAGKVSQVAPDGSVTIVYGTTQKRVPKEDFVGTVRASTGAVGVASIGPSSSPKDSVRSLATPFAAGQAVDMLDKSGSWVPCEIASVGDGTLTVVHDGDRTTIPLDAAPRVLRSASVAAGLSVGTAVEIYSNSQQKWVCGSVTQISGGCVTVMFGTAQKSVPLEHVESLIRIPGAGGNATPRSADRPYMVGASVEIFSKGQHKWVPGKVANVSADGAVTIVYGSTQKTVPKEYLEDMIRSGPAVPASAVVSISSEKPKFQTMAAANTSRIPLGARVRARGRTSDGLPGGEWQLGTVTRQNVDGTCKVTYDRGHFCDRVFNEDIELLSTPEHAPALAEVVKPKGPVMPCLTVPAARTSGGMRSLLIWIHGLAGQASEFESYMQTLGGRLPWIEFKLPEADVQPVTSHPWEDAQILVRHREDAYRLRKRPSGVREFRGANTRHCQGC